MTTLPGYVLLLKDTEDVTGKLAEQLGYAGIHVTLSNEQDCCALSVPKDQEAKAKALLSEYFTASSRERKDEELENFQENFLRRSPVFVSSRTNPAGCEIGRKTTWSGAAISVFSTSTRLRTSWLNER